MILSTITNAGAMAAAFGGLRPHGTLLVVGADMDPIAVPAAAFIAGGTGLRGHTSGTARDLVYVLAVTQLWHLLLTHLGWAALGHMTLLLPVVWWAWIYTTWMVNWLNPESALAGRTAAVVLGPGTRTADRARTLGRALDAGQAAVTLAGPIVYRLGELLFRRRMIHTGNPKRYAAIAVLAALGVRVRTAAARGLGAGRGLG